MSASPEDLLMPGGKPIGTKGTRVSIRELPGGEDEAREFFNRLSASGLPAAPSTYPGVAVDLPGGGRVGLRIVSKSGVTTVDVDIPGIPIKKLKFTGSTSDD